MNSYPQSKSTLAKAKDKHCQGDYEDDHTLTLTLAEKRKEYNCDRNRLTCRNCPMFHPK